MNKFLTDKVNNLSASATLAMAAKARELRSKGVDVIGLSLGEPDFNIPEFIKEAAVNQQVKLLFQLVQNNLLQMLLKQ